MFKDATLTFQSICAIRSSRVSAATRKLQQETTKCIERMRKDSQNCRQISNACLTSRTVAMNNFRFSAQSKAFYHPTAKLRRMVLHSRRKHRYFKINIQRHHYCDGNGTHTHTVCGAETLRGKSFLKVQLYPLFHHTVGRANLTTRNIVLHSIAHATSIFKGCQQVNPIILYAITFIRF